MKQSSEIRVLHYTPYEEDCGVAIYQKQYIDAMKTMSTPNISNTIFATSPLVYRLLKPVEQQAVLKQLAQELKDFDILHIQHEFGLFIDDDFQEVFNVGKKSGKKVIVSIHLSPEFAIKPVRLKGLGVRSSVSYLLSMRNYNRLRDWHIKPLLQADLIIVHNEMTAEALKNFGIDSSRIKKIPLPAYSYPNPQPSDLIAKQLNKKPGDIIYCSVGILHRYKGLFDSIKALKFLPENYKLAIIGGMHPISDEVQIYNKVCDLIDILGLKDRVYITGFVKDDNVMNSYIRECDVCVFPYDGVYYAHVSSGATSLALSNSLPIITYPTRVFQELSESSNGAIVLTDTFAYYELARELMRIDLKKQVELSKAFAQKMSWPKATQKLADLYTEVLKS